MEGLTEGRMVHYVMADGEHRAAVVVKHWGGDIANLLVLMDGDNDTPPHTGRRMPIGRTAIGWTMWCPSTHFDESGTEPDSWHWIERS